MKLAAFHSTIGADKDVGAAVRATVRLGLHCLDWGRRLPSVEGELGWEERFVGPVVTHLFNSLLAAQGGQGAKATWKG